MVGVFVAEPGDVEVFAAVADLVAGVGAEAAGFSLIGAVVVGGFKVGEVASGEGGAFAELGDVGSEVVDPGGGGGGSLGEEEDVGFDSLGVEDAGGESEDGVEVGFFHEVGADFGADVAFEEDVVGEDDGGAASGF